MPSSVIRRSRRQGRMKNHQVANGRPTHSATALAISGTFMYIGGSFGPTGTRSKNGPVIQRPQTYSCNASNAPPKVAQIRTAPPLRPADLGSAATLGCLDTPL